VSQDPIRIVRIIDRMNIGGPARHVTWVSSGLDPQQFETTLITGSLADGEGDMSYLARPAGVQPVMIPEMSREIGIGDLRVILKLLRTFFQLKPQIIHTHKSKAGAAGRLAATIYKWLTPSALWLRPRRVARVHTFHGHIFHSYYGRSKTALFLNVERLLARFCTDRIITLSEQQRREIHSRFKVGRPEQFRVIPLGIDLDFARPEKDIRREYGIGSRELLIGAVGRLCEVKNFGMLLRAVSQMSDGQESPLVRLLLVGDGHLRGDLESLAREQSLFDRVTFAGFRDDVFSFYRAFDLLALTSRNEGTPLTIIEALAQGCPVAATEVGGVIDLMGEHELTRDGFSLWAHGVTAPPEDVAAFARSLDFLARRPELRCRMGTRGRAFVRSHHARERLLRDLEALYRELLHIPEIGSQQPSLISEHTAELSNKADS